MAGRTILVIKLGALGDFIQALGPMAAIRRAHARDRILLLTTQPFADLARSSGYVDDVIIDKRPRWHDLKGWIELRRLLNGLGAGRVYDLQNNDRTGLYLKLFSPRPEWVGAARGASHRNVSAERTAGKAFYGHVQTLALAGINGVEVDTLGWMAPGRVFDGLHAPFVLIVPGGSAGHPEKRWPLPHYISFCGALSKRGYQPVVIGGEGEKEMADSIAEHVPQALDLTASTNLNDIATLARGAFGAVGNDTGPMHIIAPTGCASIVLFSAVSNPDRHGPIGRDVITIQKNDLNDLRPETVWDAFRAQHNLPS